MGCLLFVNLLSVNLEHFARHNKNPAVYEEQEAWYRGTYYWLLAKRLARNLKLRRDNQDIMSPTEHQI